MKKNVIIAVLAITVLMLWISNEPQEAAIYWMQRCQAAEKIIQRVDEEQPEYVMDVLCEGPEWQEWTLLGGDN